MLAALLSPAYAQGLNYGTGSGPGLCPVGTTIESGPEVFFNCAGKLDQAADGSGQVVWLGGAAVNVCALEVDKCNARDNLASI